MASFNCVPFLLEWLIREWGFPLAESSLALGNFFFAADLYIKTSLPVSIGIYEPNQFEYCVYVMYYYIGFCSYDSFPDESCDWYFGETVLGYSSNFINDESTWFSMVRPCHDRNQLFSLS